MQESTVISSTPSTASARQWRMLFIYNIYRLINVVIIFCMVWFYSSSRFNLTLYYSALGAYCIIGLLFFYWWSVRKPAFEAQVLISGTIDIIALVLFINTLGYMQSGLGILLNALVAMLSILILGHLAIFFAATASCMLLIVSVLDYWYGIKPDIAVFFYSGIHGAGCFATALTAWYLARWVRFNEQLALRRTKELASMQQLNEYIVERLQYGVVYVGMESLVKVINTAARQFFNVPEHHNHLTVAQLSASLELKYQAFLAQRGGEKQSAQATLTDPYLRVHFFSAAFVTETAVLIILEDMSGIAQEAQQLKLASLGRFSASIAHEIRNPLGVISHAVQLMGEVGALSEEDSRLKQLIIKHCYRMDGIIKNVLQLSRRQPAKADVIQLVPFLLQFKREYVAVNPCDIQLPCEGEETITFDKSQLEQVLVILCDNVRQHGRDASGAANITVSFKYEGDRLVLIFSDEGPGIKASLRETVFDPFFSTHNAGSGMGLFIAKDLCEINQARLILMTTSHGCCFTIIFKHSNEILL